MSQTPTITVEEFVRAHGLQALRGVPLDLGGDVVYVSNKLLDKLALEEWGPNDRPWRERLYGGSTPDAKMVVWIYQSQANILTPPSSGAA